MNRQGMIPPRPRCRHGSLGEACRGFGRARFRVGRGLDVSAPVAAAERVVTADVAGRSVLRQSTGPQLPPSAAAGASARLGRNATAAGRGASAGDDSRAVGAGRTAAQAGPPLSESGRSARDGRGADRLSPASAAGQQAGHADPQDRRRRHAGRRWPSTTWAARIGSARSTR